MSHVFVLNQDGTAQAVFEDYISIEYYRSWLDGGHFTMKINHNQPSVRDLKKNAILAPVRPMSSSGLFDQIYIVEQFERELDETGSGGETLTISGRDFGSFMEERVIVPTTGQTHFTASGKAETVMKRLVNFHAAIGDPLNPRTIPNLVLATDQMRGITISVKERFSNLLEVIKEVSTRAQLGWEVIFFPVDNTFNFEVFPGIDRSLSAFATGDQVVFSVDYDTIFRLRWLNTQLERKNFAFVAGQGEGVARTIVNRFLGATEPSGLDRKEIFIDARDLSATADLNERGDNKLADTQKEDAIEVEINPLGIFRYREQWDLGDIVTVSNVDWGLFEHIRIVGVTVRLEPKSGTHEIRIEVNSPWPQFKGRILNEIPDDASART